MKVLSKLILALICVCSLPVTAAEGDFQSLAPAFAAFRKQPDRELSIVATDKTFSVRTRVESVLTEDEGKQIAADKRFAIPVLTVSRDGLWVAYTADGGESVNRPISSNGATDSARQWKRREWNSLGTYGLAKWPQFVSTALKGGLSGFEETLTDDRSFYSLDFAPPRMSRIKAGPRTLAVGARFTDVMRQSPEYSQKEGAKGFVILVHDPHENVTERLATLTGIRTLIAANPTQHFRFLVEGTFRDTREIPFNGLDTAIGSEPNPGVVYRLLSQFLINVPMAYRLLYDRQIPAFAIDDNDALAYDKPQPLRSLEAQIKSLQAVGEAIIAEDSPDTELEKLVELGFTFTIANLRDVSERGLIQYWDDKAKLFKNIATRGAALGKRNPSVRNALRDIAHDAATFSDEVHTYQAASKRNDTMAPLIAAAAAFDAPEIPIAFIGSFHTQGIIDKLCNQGVGYIVIEPRPWVAATEAESNAFAAANHRNTRAKYLSDVSLNMGFVGPTTSEVTSVYAPKIRAVDTAVRERRQRAVDDLKVLTDSKIDAQKLIAALDANGALAEAQLSFGGSSPPPSNKFKRAFAYFEADQGGGGEPPRLNIFNTSDEGWRGDGRYRVLSVAMIPHDAVTEGRRRGTGLRFYSDSTAKRIYTALYDPDSKRTYFFEGDLQATASLVPTPTGTSKDPQNIRAQVAEILRKAFGRFGHG